MRHRLHATRTFRTLASLAAAAAVPASFLVFAAGGCTDRKPVEPAQTRATAPDHGHGDRHGHRGHGPGSAAPALVLSTVPAEPKAGEPVRLRAMIHRPDGTMVGDFEEAHEKLVHLIVVREGLDHFAHLHPEVDDAGNLTTEFTFPAGGRYLLYADHKPAGEAQAVARGEVRVAGAAPAAPGLTPDVPGRVSGDGLTADVTVDAARPGGETEIAFGLSDEAGQPVSDLEPYLGALGHVSILSEDGKDYVHAHPLENEDATDGPVKFAAHFTGSGHYKGWAEFQRSGRVLTVPFVLRVEPPQKT